MRILLLSTAFSGMAQRLLGELQQLEHEIEQHYDLDPDFLRTQVATFNPDVIVCPYLTQRIPEDVWKSTICLVVHPGIEGDRGPSSLDWAISEQAPEWGVTLLQAAEEMDAGDIWGTVNFPLRQASKTSIFKREVTSIAMTLIKRALKDIERGKTSGRPLDYTQSSVKGRLRPMMKKLNRLIDWGTYSSEAAVHHINAADSRPGACTEIASFEVRLFGASIETQLSGEPGEIIALHRSAACIGTANGAIWVKMLECRSHPQLPAIKLPAAMVLEKLLTPARLPSLLEIDACTPPQEINVKYEQDAAYIYFDFYNGAMSTEQCLELRTALQKVKRSEVKIIVLMGGEDFFSNGLHLNIIEASESAAQESWRNINAINDFVYEIINCPDQITVAALRSNAGAGGAIMALACDQVLIREGVVLNPHYQTMGLYGSEYWTYLLPKRVGQEAAMEITKQCLPMLAQEAFQLGMADHLLKENWHDYHQQLQQHCQKLGESNDYNALIETKRSELDALIASDKLTRCRFKELTKMKAAFFNPDSDYHKKRKAFVYKTKPEPVKTHSIGSEDEAIGVQQCSQGL